MTIGTIDQALAFLAQHQPMPDDVDLSDLAQAYERARQVFLASPDERCVPLLLNSFGNGDGFGTYQLVEDV